MDVDKDLTIPKDGLQFPVCSRLAVGSAEGDWRLHGHALW